MIQSVSVRGSEWLSDARAPSETTRRQRMAIASPSMPCRPISGCERAVQGGAEAGVSAASRRAAALTHSHP